MVKQVLKLVSAAKGRSQLDEEDSEALSACVEMLERSGGVPAPTADARLDGKWCVPCALRPSV